MSFDSGLSEGADLRSRRAAEYANSAGLTRAVSQFKNYCFGIVEKNHHCLGPHDNKSYFVKKPSALAIAAIHYCYKIWQAFTPVQGSLRLCPTGSVNSRLFAW